MKNIFKHNDFVGLFPHDAEAAAYRANEKINALIEEAPVVYGMTTEDDHVYSKHLTSNYTHKARLIFIEEIVKEPCKHRPEQRIKTSENGSIIHSIYKCGLCGIEIEPHWKEKA